MKSIKVIGYGLWIIGMLLVSMPAMAQWGNDNQVGASAPSTTFRSTSSMPAVTGVTATSLNADGTVNEGAYMSQSPGIRKPRRDGSSSNPGSPDDEEDEAERQPLGDGLWVLMALAGVYVRSRKYARKMIE